MKRLNTVLSAVLTAAVLTGCMSPRGDSIGKQKACAKEMAQEGLDIIYERNPAMLEKVAKSAGYGVYKVAGIQWGVPSTEVGWGIIHNNLTGEYTYMKLLGVGLGLGIGYTDLRAVLLFETRESIDSFINSGWEALGQANAAFKFDGFGVFASSGDEIIPGVKLYRVTANGIILQATFQGSKTWKNAKLSPLPKKK